MPSTDLVTILSTDWVASTPTRVELGEERADELQRFHDRALRECVAAHDGTVVKGSGDGILATFHSAADALLAAVEIQQRFHAETRARPAPAPIHLRVGLSAGDVVHQDGDIFGTPIIEAVRLQAAADPDGILCSDLVLVLARGRGGIRAEPAGLLELKGLPEPVPASVVHWSVAPAPRWSVPFPPELVPPANVFVGRTGELESILAVARQAECSGAVWLLGEPGIGKTRLAGEVGARLHRAGHAVLFGRCDEEVVAPYAPIIEALRWFVSHTSDERLPELLGPDPEPLARLVPDLARRLPSLAGAVPLREIEQLRLFEAVHQWLSAVGDEAPCVLVVDDVHWADRPTRLLLRYLLRRKPPARLLVLGTARDTAPDADDELAELLDDLETAGGSVRFRLTGLSPVEIATLVPDGSAEELAARTGGNPLFLMTLLAMGDGGRAGDLRATLRRRLRGLDADARSFMQVAAVVGLEFPLRIAAHAAGIGDEHALDLVEQAVAGGLVREVAADRFRFSHALTRDALDDELSASRRARAHLATAQAIEEQLAGEIDEHLRSLAYHYEQAATSPDEVARAAGYRFRAGRRAVEVLAYDAAAEDFEAALRLRDQAPAGSPFSHFEGLMELGRAKFRAARFYEAFDTFRAAADDAREHGDWAGFADAAWHLETSNFPTGRLGHEAVSLLTEALAHRDGLPPATVARLTGRLARAHAFTARSDLARRTAQEALELARPLGDPDVTVQVLDAVAAALVSGFAPPFLRLVLELGDEFAPAESGVTMRDVFANFSQYMAAAAVHVGDRDRADRWIQHIQWAADHLRLFFARYLHSSWRCAGAILDGELAEAETFAREGLELGEAVHDDTSGPFGVQMFVIRREQDRLHELVPAVQLILRTVGPGGLWAPGATLLLAELDLREQAQALLDRTAQESFAAVPEDSLRLGSLAFLADAAAQLGDTRRAASLLELLAPWSGYGCSVGGYTVVLGAADRYLARLHEVLGHLDEAEALYERAVAFNRRLRSPLWTAHSLVDWGALRMQRGDDRARPLLDLAGDLAARHDLVRVRRRLATMGSTL